MYKHVQCKTIDYGLHMYMTFMVKQSEQVYLLDLYTILKLME